MTKSEKPEPEPESEPAEAKPTSKREVGASKLQRKWVLFAIVAVASLIADQATKIWARGALPVFDVHGLSLTDAFKRHHGDLPGAVAEIVRTGHACAIPDDMMTHSCLGDSVPVVDSFWHWRLSMNPGSAFGLFSSQGSAGRIMLSIVGILAVFGMLWMLRKARPDQRVLHWALALVAGGAVGNLIDRIYYGVVTDFILWKLGPYSPEQHRFEHEWPVFNVADIVLVVGVGLMFIDIQKEGKREKAKKKRRQEKAKAAGLVKDL